MYVDAVSSVQKYCTLNTFAAVAPLWTALGSSQLITIITLIFCCDNLWKSKFMALEKPGKLQ